MSTTHSPATPDLAAEAARLQSPEAMLETLHLAYQHLLDEVGQPDGQPTPQDDRRLGVEDQRELGRRLASYWGIKEPFSDPADDPARLRAGAEMLKTSGAKWLNERDEARAQLEACKGVLKEWQEAERKARQEAAIELERATHYRDQWQKAMAAGRALAAQFARHDGCSRWSVADAAAIRGWEAAAGEVGS